MSLYLLEKFLKKLGLPGNPKASHLHTKKEALVSEMSSYTLKPIFSQFFITVTKVPEKTI
jgi:hypothetical protein